MRMSDGLKARRKTALEQIQALLKAAEASEAKDFTAEQAAEFDRLEKEVEELDGKIERAERAEKSSARAGAAPATQPVGEQAKAPAQVKEQLKADKKVSLSMAASVKSQATGEHPMHILEQEGYGQFVRELAEINGITRSVNTLTPSAGGILMPAPARGELLDLAYPDTNFLQGNPVRVPLNGGQYEQPYGVTGATAGYVAEAGKKPVSDLTFAKISMKAKKLAAIVLITKEARKWLIPDIEAYVNRNLRIALPQALDTAAFLGTGANDSPLGILNVSGIGVFDASAQGFADATKPTLQEIDRICSKMFLYQTARGIALGANTAWRMGFRTLEYLKNLRVGDSNGVYAFPELQGDNPRFKGFRVLRSTSVPENLGSTTDESILALINFDNVLFGEEEGLTTAISDQATIDVSGNLVHLFQQNMYALLAEMAHDFGVQRPAAVVRLNKVRWGA